MSVRNPESPFSPRSVAPVGGSRREGSAVEPPGVQGRNPLGAPTGRDGFRKLLGLLGKQKHFPAMSLRQAISSLGLLDDAALDALHLEDPRLLADHCADLVSRKLLSREALGHALARMANLPGVDAIDLQVAPPAFAHLLLREAEPPALPPPAARTLAGLLAALEQQRSAVESLREAIAALHLLDEDTLDACAHADPSILRENSIQLVTRVLLAPDELGRALARVAGAGGRCAGLRAGCRCV
jgi:hypothetical protein